MDTLEAIEQRRSIKHYDTSHRMSDDEVARILSLAVLSPTSFNIQNWRFVHVVDEALRREIRAAAWDQAQVTDASMLLLLCADLRAWAHDPERYWRDAPKEAQDILVPLIWKFYDGNEALQRDEAMRSVGIAAQTIMLGAKGMGYDSCPMIGFDGDAVAKLINLPENHVVGMMVVIGKATQPAGARGGSVPMAEVVVQDKFP
jgi:nitroreductase